MAAYKTGMLSGDKAKLRLLRFTLQNSALALTLNQWQISNLLDQLRFLFEVFHA